MTEQRKTRVIGYIRVSTAKQEKEGWSLEAQTARLRAYAEATDLELLEPILIDSASGKSLKRKGLQEALARMKLEAEGLLIAKLDRLTRRVRDLGDLIDDYFAKDFQLLSVMDAIDTRSATGRMVLNVLTSITQWERETISDRTKEVLNYLQSQGVRIGSAPLGQIYTEELDSNGRRIIQADLEEVATVLRICELRSAGKTLKLIAEMLTTEGCKTKRGGVWAPETVRQVLKRSALLPAPTPATDALEHTPAAAPQPELEPQSSPSTPKA